MPEVPPLVLPFMPVVPIAPDFVHSAGGTEI
jgi:hypothetical protein